MEKVQRNVEDVDITIVLMGPNTVKRNNSISEDIPLEKMAITTKRSRKSKPVKTEDQPKKLRRQRSTLLSINQVPELSQEVGELFVFGFGDNGRLGLGPISERQNPFPLKALHDKNIVDVASGEMHCVAITKDGELYSWGCNDEGALGRPTPEEEDMAVPGRVENLDGVKIVKVECGAGNTMAISDAGKLYCWGRFRSGEGAEAFSLQEKTRVLPAIFEPLAKYTVVDIASGDNHCLALTSTGHVYSWGVGGSSATGRRVLSRRPLNTLVPERLLLSNIKAVGAGSEHSFALSYNNELFMWGLNGHGQCCQSPQDVPMSKTLITDLQDLGTIKAVDGGSGHSIVLMDDGKVYGFGKALYGQLGISKEKVEDQGSQSGEKYIAKPVLAEIEQVSRVSVAGDHVLALTAQGDIYCWGSNDMNEIGSLEHPCYKPTKLPGQKIEGRTFLRLATGVNHSVVLVAKNDKTLRATANAAVPLVQPS